MNSANVRWNRHTAHWIPDRGFATRVLAMIGKENWTKITSDTAKNAEEYALALLTCGDKRIESENFNKLLDRKYGKPAQGVFLGDTREETRELDFGDLPMPPMPASRKLN